MDLLRLHFNRPDDDFRILPTEERSSLSFTVTHNDIAPGFSGTVKLPPPNIIREIHHMLDWAQVDPLCGIDPTRPACLEALRTFNMLRQNRLDQQWPIRIGKWLYRKFFEANSDIVTLVSPVLKAASQHADQPTRLCILIDFSELASQFHGLITDLASFPWEALSQDAIEPLEQSHAVVIVRQMYEREVSTTHNYNVHAPTRVLAITPLFDPTRRMRSHEKEARPLNPTTNSHRTPLLWCDCPPIEPGISIDLLQKRLEDNEHHPHILHYFGHGVHLTQTTDTQGPRMFALQFDGKLPNTIEHIAPRGLRVMLRNENLIFLALFACLSGTMPELQGEDAHYSSAILALKHIPAVLAMSARMPQRMAATAGKIFYERLAQGATLLEAIHAMRRKLWNEAELNQVLWSERRAWCVPVLYLNVKVKTTEIRFADSPLSRARQVTPLQLELQRNRDQDELVQVMLNEIDRGRHVLITGTSGTCRSTLLHKLHTALQDQREISPDQVLFLSRQTAVASTATHDIWKTFRRMIVAALAQLGGQQIHWNTAHEQFQTYLADLNPESQLWNTAHEQFQTYLADLNPEPRLLYVLIDDCDGDLARELLDADNPTLRCVLVADKFEVQHPSRIHVVNTSQLKPPLSLEVHYDWYFINVRGSFRWEILRVLHLLLTVDCPLKHEEVRQILKYEAERLTECLRNLARPEMHYAVHNDGWITTRIDPQTWWNHPECANAVVDLVEVLQKWCDSQWHEFGPRGRKKPLPESMLHILSHPQLRTRLQPVLHEPIDEAVLSPAYTPWLDLVKQAWLSGNADLCKRVCDLIVWRANDGPNAARFTALDRWVIEGIALAVQNPEAAVTYEEKMPIDEASIVRALESQGPSGSQPNREQIENELRSTVRDFWEREVLKKLTYSDSQP